MELHSHHHSIPTECDGQHEVECELTLKGGREKREFEINRAGTMHSRSHGRGLFRMYIRQGSERQLAPRQCSGEDEF